MDPKVTLTTEAQPTQDVAKPVKEKKPRTEAQKAATAKALAAMTAKRKEIVEKKKEVKEKVKQAKKVVEDKILKEDLAFATKHELESMRKELMELRAHHEAMKIAKTEKAAPERVVERIVEKHIPTAQPAAPKLSGYALLDRLFLEK